MRRPSFNCFSSALAIILIINSVKRPSAAPPEEPNLEVQFKLNAYLKTEKQFGKGDWEHIKEFFDITHIFYFVKEDEEEKKVSTFKEELEALGFSVLRLHINKVATDEVRGLCSSEAAGQKLLIAPGVTFLRKAALENFGCLVAANNMNHFLETFKLCKFLLIQQPHKC